MPRSVEELTSPAEIEQHGDQIGIIHNPIQVHILWQKGLSSPEGKQHSDEVAIVHAAAAIYITLYRERVRVQSIVDANTEATERVQLPSPLERAREIPVKG